MNKTKSAVILVLLLLLMAVTPAAAQTVEVPTVTAAPTAPYDAAILALIGVLIAVLGIGGYVLVRNSSTRMIAEVVVSVLEVAVKLTPSTTDDAEVAKLRAELEKLKAQFPTEAQSQELVGMIREAMTVTGADVSRDEVQADG